MADTPLTPRLLTVKEVAESLRVHARTAYRLVTEGQIRSIRIGSQWRVPESALAEFIEKGLSAVPASKPKKAGGPRQFKLPLD